jgi:ribosomal protein S18 acetylase RimI-like enzyme
VVTDGFELALSTGKIQGHATIRFLSLSMIQSPVSVGVMTSTDLPFADSLRSIAGWNQTMDDWERFIDFAPNGCFVAEWEDNPAGTATTITYENQLAWIGMVLVDPQYRRRGIATALLEHCVHYLQSSGIRSIKLDATPAGEEVYTRMGFKAEFTLTRWRGTNDGQCRNISATRNLPEIEPLFRLDREAFGVSRAELLRSLRDSSRACLGLRSEESSGYGMLRSGPNAFYLGPVIATSPTLGCELIEALLAEVPQNQPILWDIPDSNSAPVDMAEKHGFSRERSFTRMFLGDNISGNSELVFGIAGPELG